MIYDTIYIYETKIDNNDNIRYTKILNLHYSEGTIQRSYPEMKLVVNNARNREMSCKIWR